MSVFLCVFLSDKYLNFIFGRGVYDTELNLCAVFNTQNYGNFLMNFLKNDDLAAFYKPIIYTRNLYLLYI